MASARQKRAAETAVEPSTSQIAPACAQQAPATSLKLPVKPARPGEPPADPAGLRPAGFSRGSHPGPLPNGDQVLTLGERVEQSAVRSRPWSVRSGRVAR